MSKSFNERKASAKKVKRRLKKNKWKSKPAIAAYCAIGLLLVLSVSVYAMFNHYAGKIDYQPASQSINLSAVLETQDGTGEDSAQEEIDALEAQIKENLEAGATEIVYNKNVLNILLIGSDTRGEERGRSDTMLIISINKETKQIVMSSLMRDIYLSIPGVGNNRLNAAYAFGGAGLLKETILSNFGIQIDRYVQVNFESFIKIVDLIGGVDIELSADEIEHINKRAQIKVTGAAGLHHLNGDQALQYSRIRYLDSDFVRTERQRNVLTSIFKKSKTLGLAELDALLNEVLPLVTTDLPKGEIFTLMLSSLTYKNYELVSFRVPIDNSWTGMQVNGMSVLGLDFPANRKALQEIIYGEIEE